MRKVGTLTERAASLLGLALPDDRTIYIGPTNTSHMKTRHPADFVTYGDKIPEIISSPDYIGLHKSNGSIEYVKEYKINNDFVKVAVRVSGGGKLFARSLYVLNRSRVQNFIAAGTLKKY